MNSPTPHHRIEQPLFTEYIDYHLGRAHCPDTALDEALAAAATVNKRFEEIQNATLEVHPPLTSAQIARYSEVANAIIAIGDKKMPTREKSCRQKPGPSHRQRIK